MKQLTLRSTQLFLALILVAGLLACGGAEERKIKYLEKGKAFLADKNYEKAKIEIKNVLQIDPKFAEAYYIMGQLEEKRKELPKALGNYKKAIELDPEHTDAKVKLAKIYVIAGTESFIKEAKSLLQQVRESQEENTEADLVAATIEYKTGSKTKATNDLEMVVAKNKKLVEGISLLATIYAASGDESKAIDLLTTGAEDNPENIPLRLTLAKFLARNNDLLGAEKYLKQALKLEPEKYALHVALASLYATSDQLDKAENVLRNAITLDEEDANRYLVLVELFASRESVKKAEDELEKAITEKPDLYDLKFAQIKFYEKVGKRQEAKLVLQQIIEDKSYEVEGVNARTKLANYLLQENDRKGAKKYVNEVLVEYPSNNEALLITSKLALADLDAVSAINNLRTVVKNDPKNAEASLLLAQAHELNQESSLAENELKKAIEINPVNGETHVNYARFLATKGRMGEAIDVVDKALTYFKDSYELMNIKLKIIASQGKEKEVVALMNRMEQANSNNAEININRGQYYLSKRDSEKAIAEFEKAYAKSQDKYKSLELITKTYVSTNQADKALNRLNKRLQKQPDDAMANLLIGQIYLTQKKIEQARKQFTLASKSAEGWFIPYSAMATSYLSEKNYDKALQVYQDALSKLKNKAPAQMQIAAIYERNKRYNEAMDTYKDILDENSKNKLAANNYASLLLDYGDENDAKKALELSIGFDKIQQPALQDTLAWAYAKSGDNAKAVEILKPIVEKAPQIAVFRYHLGYALYHMGDKAAAKSHLEIAKNSEQQFMGKDKVDELLKSI